MQRMCIFTCGGTLDKIYFDAGSRCEVGPPNIPGILAELKLDVDFEECDTRPHRCTLPGLEPISLDLP